MTMPMRPPPAPGVQSTRPSENAATQLLTPEENQRLFRLLGERCQTLATTVVQLYRTNPPTHTTWNRLETGVLCFVRDNSRRAYFLQLFSADARVWEQELYQNFQYTRTRQFFHTFEAHDYRAGLNFADEPEADQFGRRVEEHLRHKQIKKEQRNRSRQQIETRHSNGTLPRSATLPQQRPAPAQLVESRHSNDRGTSRGRQKKLKLNKADISLPTNFQHISHVGWDPHKGFDLENVDPNLKQFFNKAGVSDTQLQDQDTRQFIYDFIDKHGGVEAAIKEVHLLGMPGGPGPPPPVPTRQPPAPGRPAAPPAPPLRSTPPVTHSGAAPPPPPSRTRQAPPHPPSAGAKPGVPAPPPPPPTPSSAPPPPPPPPPPAGMSAPPPPPPPPSAAAKPGGGPPAASDNRNHLLDSIRAGTTLRPVSASSDSGGSGGGGGGGGGRDNLLAQIRSGATLKPVTDKPASSEAAPPGLAGALARALADRKRVIHSSDEDDDEEEEEDDEDEWED